MGEAIEQLTADAAEQAAASEFLDGDFE